jgi:hypothetical protein
MAGWVWWCSWYGIPRIVGEGLEQGEKHFNDFERWNVPVVAKMFLAEIIADWLLDAKTFL